jgi:hypothetical protein
MQRSFFDPLKGFAPGDKPVDLQNVPSIGPATTPVFAVSNGVKGEIRPLIHRREQAFALKIDNCAAGHSLRK